MDLVGILLKDYGLHSNSNGVAMRDLLITDNKKGTIIATLGGAFSFLAQNFRKIHRILLCQN